MEYNSVLSKKLHKDIQFCIDQMPGYFLWKDINSIYMTGCLKTAKLFGFKHSDELIGITDYEVRCDAAEFADLFIKQDLKVKQTSSPITVLDVHPYLNGEMKTLLINKSLLRGDNHSIIGISCHCIEINDQDLDEIAIQLSKRDANKFAPNSNRKKAKNYYLNEQYTGLALSRRQSECLFFLIRGKTAKEIARCLNLSPRTIESYIETIKDKMMCKTRSDILDKAIEAGYYEIIPKGIVRNQLKHMLEDY